MPSSEAAPEVDVDAAEAGKPDADAHAANRAEAESSVVAPMGDGAPDVSTWSDSPMDQGSTDPGEAATPEAAGSEAAAPGPVCGPGHSALQFSGGYLTMQRLVADDFTIEAWIKTTTSNSGTYWWQGTPLFWGDLMGAANDFAVTLTNGVLHMNVGAPDAYIQGTTPVTTASWVHVAATRSLATGRIQLFVNGVPDADGVGPTASLSAAPTLIIGAKPGGVTTFAGSMDELKLWSVVRAPADIVADMSAPLSGTEPGLVGYYNFDEGSGPQANDHSPSQNPAMLVGPFAWPAESPACAANAADSGALDP